MRLLFAIYVVFKYYEGKSKTLVDSRICKGVVFRYCTYVLPKLDFWFKPETDIEIEN